METQQPLTVSVLPVPAVHPPLLALAVVAVAVGPLDDAGRPVPLVVSGLGLARQRGQGHHGQGAQQRQRALHGVLCFGSFLARASRTLNRVEVAWENSLLVFGMPSQLPLAPASS